MGDVSLFLLERIELDLGDLHFVSSRELGYFFHFGFLAVAGCLDSSSLGFYGL